MMIELCGNCVVVGGGDRRFTKDDDQRGPVLVDDDAMKLFKPKRSSLQGNLMTPVLISSKNFTTKLPKLFYPPFWVICTIWRILPSPSANIRKSEFVLYLKRIWKPRITCIVKKKVEKISRGGVSCTSADIRIKEERGHQKRGAIPLMERKERGSNSQIHPGSGPSSLPLKAFPKAFLDQTDSDFGDISGPGLRWEVRYFGLRSHIWENS